MTKTAITFYCDDTNPFCAPPESFKTFLDFTASEGIRGESSAILGYGWPEHGVLSHPSTEAEERYIEQLQRAYVCGIDTHCELMTHAGRFDFTGMRIPEGAIHEGVWLYEPGVSTEEYERYFGQILAEGERIGVRFTGVTWPGCGCEACTRRYHELREAGITGPNPNFWQALLRLSQQGRFRGKTAPCFFGGALEQCADRVMAQDGEYAIVDLPPNAHDRFGLWLNAVAEVDADYYLTADGRGGRIFDLVQAGAPYVLFYAHWQGLNPANGVGWKAFTQVVGRVQKHLGDQVEWMRPSELTERIKKN